MKSLQLVAVACAFVLCAACGKSENGTSASPEGAGVEATPGVGAAPDNSDSLTMERDTTAIEPRP